MFIKYWGEEIPYEFKFHGTDCASNVVIRRWCIFMQISATIFIFFWIHSRCSIFSYCCFLIAECENLNSNSCFWWFSISSRGSCFDWMFLIHICSVSFSFWGSWNEIGVDLKLKFYVNCLICGRNDTFGYSMIWKVLNCFVIGSIIYLLHTYTQN